SGTGKAEGALAQSWGSDVPHLATGGCDHSAPFGDRAVSSTATLSSPPPTVQDPTRKFLSTFPPAALTLRSWLLVLTLVPFLFIPFWTNFILRIYAMISLLGNHGLLNQFLIKMGIVSEPITLLYTRTGVFIGLVYNYLPFLVVPIFSALEKFDVTLREAAQDL